MATRLLASDVDSCEVHDAVGGRGFAIRAAFGTERLVEFCEERRGDADFASPVHDVSVSRRPCSRAIRRPLASTRALNSGSRPRPRWPPRSDVLPRSVTPQTTAATLGAVSLLSHADLRVLDHVRAVGPILLSPRFFDDVGESIHLSAEQVGRSIEVLIGAGLLIGEEAFDAVDALSGLHPVTLRITLAGERELASS